MEMITEGEGSSQGTSIKDSWTRTTEGGRIEYGRGGGGQDRGG